MGQRCPVPQRVRRSRDRHWARGHRGPHPRPERRDGRDPRASPRGPAGPHDLELRPSRRRAGRVGPDEGAAGGRARPPAGGEGVLPARRLRGLDRPGAVAGPRPGRHPAVHGRDDGRHHRTAPAADPPAAPGAARSADRPAEPDGVLRAPRRGAGRGRPRRDLLPRPRRVQGRQRHPRPRPGRRAPAGHRAAAHRCSRPRAPRRPDGRRRVRRPGRARRRQRADAPRRPHRARRQSGGLCCSTGTSSASRQAWAWCTPTADATRPS